eukprot:TRINITY_DN21518_c0_g1_i1.p1 TRINITY_DN21518_c0_g1~~TRINITY_DN21518_c0_g1_i1.p1  ORF type:complete len:366 (-),score=108.36 TRINITY_DN21518_c0_g1_i1:53-1150(-)
MNTRIILAFIFLFESILAQGNGTWDVTGYLSVEAIPSVMTVYWKVEGTMITFGIVSQSTGYVAFGISPDSTNPMMVGSDAFIGSVINGVASGRDYYLSAQASCSAGEGVCDDSAYGHKDDVTVLYGDLINGVTRIKYTRPLIGSDAAPIDITIGDGSVGFIAAYGSSTTIQYHANRNFGSVNFVTGAATVAADTTDLKAAHGYLMFFAWGLLLPLGSGIARWAKKFGWWFNIHRLLQSVGVLATVAAFVIAVEFSTSHFDTPHKIIGLTVLCLALIQPPMGILADKWFSLNRDGTPIFPDYTHWLFGWSAVILGLINVAIGLFVFYGNKYVALVIAYIAWASLVAIILIITTIVMLAKYGTKGEH